MNAAAVANCPWSIGRYEARNPRRCPAGDPKCDRSDCMVAPTSTWCFMTPLQFQQTPPLIRTLMPRSLSLFLCRQWKTSRRMVRLSSCGSRVKIVRLPSGCSSRNWRNLTSASEVFRSSTARTSASPPESSSSMVSSSCAVQARSVGGQKPNRLQYLRAITRSRSSTLCPGSP